MIIYLKCQYSDKGLAFPNEYSVWFNMFNEEELKIGYCVVNREDVVVQEGDRGLVKLIKFDSKNKEKACVEINDNLINGLSRFVVPIEEIVIFNDIIIDE